MFIYILNITLPCLLLNAPLSCFNGLDGLNFPITYQKRLLLDVCTLMSPVRMITITSVCQIPLLCCICACIPGTDEAPHKSTPVSPVPNRSCPPLPITLLSDLRKDSPCQSAAHHVFHTLRHCNMLTTYPGLLMLSSCSFLLLHWDSITKTSSENWKPPIFHTVELTNSTTM